MTDDDLRAAGWCPVGMRWLRELELTDRERRILDASLIEALRAWHEIPEPWRRPSRPLPLRSVGQELVAPCGSCRLIRDPDAAWWAYYNQPENREVTGPAFRRKGAAP
jgi:hypothetical protein